MIVLPHICIIYRRFGAEFRGIHVIIQGRTAVVRGARIDALEIVIAIRKRRTFGKLVVHNGFISGKFRLDTGQPVWPRALDALSPSHGDPCDP